jgi:hypothetical protein
MSDFFDNMCRTLATPMSRSSALKLIAGGLASAVLAPFSFGQRGNGNGNGNNGNGQGRCQQGSPCAGANQGCCPPGQTCFGDQICCGGPLVGAICDKARGGSNMICVQRDASGNLPDGCRPL